MEQVHHIFWVLSYIAAIGFMISGLDDFLFDLQFLIYLFRIRNRPHIKIQELKNKPEQWLAIFVPAWKEGGVVNRMAEYAAKVLLYEKYEIFIGVYPNDPETCSCVDQVVKLSPRIQKVLLPHPGPTSKADCLNWIFRAMRLREIPGVREYAAVCLHDSEDILHPLTLKIYNWFVPDHLDMAQIPVFPLELNPWKYWVGNTYMDEFCELHIKDMYARQQIGGVIPSAGVGTAFGRRALDELGSHNQGDPFRIGNLTEDYEIGIRLKRANFRTAFVNYPIDRVVKHKLPDGSFREEVITEIIAVRENFPTEFQAAVRQRSRWILGIAFQTWEQTGWSGSLQIRYTLFRDRRAPLVHMINTLGYVVLVYAIINWIAVRTHWAPEVYIRPLFDTNSILWKLIVFDSCLLLYRFAQKAYCVSTIFSWKQGFFSIPRFIVNNTVNFFATVRATRMYLSNRFLGTPLVWLKTQHVFPGHAELAEYTKTVEDLLVEGGMVTREQVELAMKERSAESVPSVLLRMGFIDEKQFTEIWSQHSGLPEKLVDSYQLPLKLLQNFPENHSIEMNALPLRWDGERLVVAFKEPPNEARLEELSKLFNAPLTPVLSRPSNLTFARNRAYPCILLPHSIDHFDLEILNLLNATHEERFQEAIHLQHQTHQSLPDVLVDMGEVSQEEARHYWATSIHCPPIAVNQTKINFELLEKIGEIPCLLHRLAPLQNNQVATTSRVHPELSEWLSSILGQTPKFFGDLPRNIDTVSRLLSASFDADQKLTDYLRDKEMLQPADLIKLQKMRRLLTDPIMTIIRQLNFAGDEQLHEAFLHVSRLQVSSPCQQDEVLRLSKLLHPIFSQVMGCHAIREHKSAITLGLARFLTPRELLIIHERFTGYSIFFQAISYSDSQSIRTWLKETKDN